MSTRKPDPSNQPPRKPDETSSVEEWRLQFQLPPDATHTDFGQFDLTPLPPTTVDGAELISAPEADAQASVPDDDVACDNDAATDQKTTPHEDVSAPTHDPQAATPAESDAARVGAPKQARNDEPKDNDARDADARDDDARDEPDDAALLSDELDDTAEFDEATVAQLMELGEGPLFEDSGDTRTELGGLWMAANPDNEPKSAAASVPLFTDDDDDDDDDATDDHQETNARDDVPAPHAPPTPVAHDERAGSGDAAEPVSDATATAAGFEGPPVATPETATDWRPEGTLATETNALPSEGFAAPPMGTETSFDPDETATRIGNMPSAEADLVDDDEVDPNGDEVEPFHDADTDPNPPVAGGPLAQLGTDDANYGSTRTDVFRAGAASPVPAAPTSSANAPLHDAETDAFDESVAPHDAETAGLTDVGGSARAALDPSNTGTASPPRGASGDSYEEETDPFAGLDLPPEVPLPYSGLVEDEEVSVPALRRRRKSARRGPTLRQRFAQWRENWEDLEVGEKVRAFGQRLKKSLKPARGRPAPQAEIRLEKTSEWWRKTLVEIGMLYAIIVPIELASNGGMIGAFGVHPHPYWLVVLPMAGARGAVAGLISAFIASLLYTIGAFQALSKDGAETLFTYRHMMEPILFFAVGYFAGELHDELELRYKQLKRLLDDVQVRNTRLRQERDVLSDANKELERRIVDDSVQFNNLIVAATRIEKAGRTEVFEIALDLVEEHCGASSSVLILLEDGTLDLLCQRGWRDDQTSHRLAAARESEFVHRALSEGESINGFHPEESAPEKGPLVVAPLYDASGVAKALLCLDEIPLSRLNESTVSIFLGIGEWVSATLGRLDGGPTESVARPNAPIPAGLSDAWLGRPAQLGERLRLEVERCTRYGVPTSFLVIQATEWTDATREGRDVLDHFVLTHFTGGMRPSDALFAFGYPGCYLLVLSGTTIEGAEVVRQRLTRRIEYSASKTVGTVEIAAMGPDTESPDLVSLIERVADRFRRFSTLPLDRDCPVTIPESTRCGNIEEFIRRLRLETSLATRNGFDFHVVGISAEFISESDADLLARHVHDAGLRVLRPTDGVYVVGRQHCSILLPNTDGEQAATIAHRLVTAARERDPDAPYGDMETQVLSLGAHHPDASSLLLALSRAQRKENA